MINLTDEELCMLEQLTYLDEDVAAAIAGYDTIVPNSKGVSK